METLTLVLLGLNLVLLLAVLVIVLVRPRGGGSASSAGSSAEQQAAIRQLGGELRQDFATQRGELAQSLAAGQQQLAQSLTVGQQQLDARLQAVAASQTEELAREREARIAAQSEQRELLEQRLTGLSDRMHANSRAGLEAQTKLQQSLGEELGKQQQTLREELGKQQATMQQELEKLRQGNEAKLEKMRETVDEKLQGTLERRLGESFKLVSDRLEQVQKGLGEMQTLASDVGGLKRVLTNVKSRGGWGEVQLARQLEDMLTPEQYAENVAVRPGSAERVEFAVKLPGRSGPDGHDETPVWLPIDSKFPQEDYERLLDAQEVGEKEVIDAASKKVEQVILAQAKLIRDKYIEPPHTTDFAIMYLPTEGLFAEVIRRPGLASRLQNEFHITVAGPTVLMSLLNSLQLGFRTLAIEKRSSEVWKVLGAAKTEFRKYGQVWAKLEKHLQTAQNTVHQAGVRTRAVERALSKVESLDGTAELESDPDEAQGELDELYPEVRADQT